MAPTLSNLLQDRQRGHAAAAEGGGQSPPLRAASTIAAAAISHRCGAAAVRVAPRICTPRTSAMPVSVSPHVIGFTCRPAAMRGGSSPQQVAVPPPPWRGAASAASPAARLASDSGHTVAGDRSLPGSPCPGARAAQCIAARSSLLTRSSFCRGVACQSNDKSTSIEEVLNVIALSYIFKCADVMRSSDLRSKACTSYVAITG